MEQRCLWVSFEGTFQQHYYIINPDQFTFLPANGLELGFEMVLSYGRERFLAKNVPYFDAGQMSDEKQRKVLNCSHL